ncbi:MAG: hypothetical protein QNL33_14235 [Akkermansiaceae bacterium]
MGNTLISPEMDTLLTIVEEATRSSKEGIKYFVEPSGGSLRRAISRRHHLVFGRRGSGKSSLLRKAASDLTVERAPIAWVDLEPFKGHPYPDLLLSVLIATFSSFKSWLDEAAIAPSTRTTFWQTLFGETPSKPSYNRKECAKLSKKFGIYLKDLDEQLHAVDDAELSFKAENAETSAFAAEISAGVNNGFSNVRGKASEARSLEHNTQIEEKHKRSKIDFLRRNIMLYQDLFEEINVVSGGVSLLR